MNIFSLNKQFYDLLIVNINSITYIRFIKKQQSLSIVKIENLEVTIFKDSLLIFDNLEKGLASLISKYKLSSLGIILNLPNILTQRITLARTNNPREAIINYLKVSSPLSLEKYTFFYKEDRYQLSVNVSNFNVVFVPKDIIDSLLAIIEKYNLIPLFISPITEAIYYYLLNKTLIDFNEDYIVFFVEKQNLISLLIKKLRIEKILIDEINLEVQPLNIIIGKFINFFKTNIAPDTKILFISDYKLGNLQINFQTLFLDIKPLEIIIEGSYLIFEKVFSDQEFIDFLPIKSYFAYFLNKLPSLIIFTLVYACLLLVITSGVFLFFNQKLNEEILIYQKNLNDQQLILQKNVINDQQNFDFDKFNGIINKLTIYFKLSYNIEKALSLSALSNLEFAKDQPLGLSFIINKDNKDQFQADISKEFNLIELIKEESIANNLLKLDFILK